MGQLPPKQTTPKPGVEDIALEGVGNAPPSNPGTTDLATMSFAPLEGGVVGAADGPTSSVQDSERSSARVFAIVTALFLSLFIAALDATIVATALPVITRELSSAAGYTWIGGAYLLANAVSGPIWAKLSDIWGRKPMLLVCIALCFVSSTVCATAKTIQVLIAARAFQGMAGGGMILLVHICISDLFSVRKRSLYWGLTEFIWASAGAVGPSVGGVFADLVSWRWCFWINLPICGLAFALILMFLDIKHESTSLRTGLKALDWAGLVSFLGFTLLLLLGLNFGGSAFPWDSAKVIALIVVGGLMIFAFVYSEARVAKYPLIPMALFKDMSNVASLLVVFFHGMVFISAEYYLPLYFQSALGSSPLQSGVLILPVILATALAGIAAGFLMHRTGTYRELMWIGSILMALGRGLFILYYPHSSIGTIIAFQVLAGIGTGFLFAPPLVAVQARVEHADMSTATSTLSFIRNMALTFAVVLGGVVFQNSMDAQASNLRQAGLSDLALMQLTGKDAAANVNLVNVLSDPNQRSVVREAFSWSIRNMWIMYTVLAVLCVLSSFFVVPSHLSREHTETVTGIREEKD